MEREAGHGAAGDLQGDQPAGEYKAGLVRVRLAGRTEAKPVLAFSYKCCSPIGMVGLSRGATHIADDGEAGVVVGEAEHEPASDPRDRRSVGECYNVLALIVRHDRDVNWESASVGG